jgi:hypothetical protein
MTRNGTHFHQTDNTAAALDIRSIITVRIITMSNNQCHGKESFLRSHQLLSYSFNSLSSTEHVSSLLFSPQPDWPNFFSPSTFYSHTYSSLNNIAVMAHMFSALQTQCWYAKMRYQKKVKLTNQVISNLMYWSQIGTNNIWWTSNLKPHQPYLTTLLNLNNQTKNIDDDGKHNPQTKLPVLNWHNQNPNITTVEMLLVLLQWLCTEVWESEFHYLWQQRTCHCVCSLVYIYITATKSGVDCSLWLRISDNPVHMYHVTFTLHDQAIQLPSSPP